MFFRNRPLRVIGLAPACVGLVLSGCGDFEHASAPQTVTVVERTVTVRAPAQPESVSETPPDEEQSVAPQEGSGGSGSSGNVRVPNVVGKDHQLAQDTMQAAGLDKLAEEDATGQGRALILDRNWTVVSQSPRAGTQVDEDQTIILRSRKDGD